MIKLNIKDDLNELMKRYESLIEDASLLEKIDPKKSMRKLRQALKIERQIEELKLSKFN